MDRSGATSRGATLHVLAHLRPNALFMLKANGQPIASLRADKTGRITFNYKRGYTVPRRFELGLANQ